MKKLAILAAVAAFSLFNLSSTIAASAAENSAYLQTTIAGAGPDMSDPFIASRLGMPVQPKAEPTLLAAVTTSDAPILLAQAGGSTRGAGGGSSGPSLGQRTFWGVVGGVALNLLTGNISGMAWAWHAVVSGGGTYVGATIVADKMK